MSTIILPNIRELFIPDPGYIIADIDLDRADAQVVAWEANDPILKQIFLSGDDLHSMNAAMIGCSRPLAKMACHAMNYGVGIATLSQQLGLPQSRVRAIRQKWFDVHPWIAAWHDKVESDLQHYREVSNAFGFKRYYFDRIDGLLPQALAWIPQSTVGLVINEGWANLRRNLPEIQVLLQVHDSLVIQIPKCDYPHCLPEIHKSMLIEIPYADPLTIPVGIKTSDRSWAHCKERSWEV